MKIVINAVFRPRVATQTIVEFRSQTFFCCPRHSHFPMSVLKRLAIAIWLGLGLLVVRHGGVATLRALRGRTLQQS